MRGVRVVCKACKFYWQEGIWYRCIHPSNTYEYIYGQGYKLHPTAKNLRGRCEDYEEINSDNTSSSDAAGSGM
jgi:hypothetical protein